MIPPSDEQERIRLTRLRVSGMYCPICATRIHSSLVALDGVLNAQVNHLVGVVDVIFDSNSTSVPALIRAVIQAGDDNRYTYRATIATLAQPNRLSNTLARPTRRPHKVRPR
ncbi:MAG TPA: heavy-metal-associated domain-containing protein, partial [Anaerolineae bacterium]